MDPQVPLTKLQSAVSRAEWSDAVTHLNDYYQARIKGGVEPPKGDAIANGMARKVAEALLENS